MNRLAEQCLNLILAMVMERQTHNIGLVSERDELKHRMIQLLCVEPTSHSAVIDKLAIYEKDNKLVDEILKEISELKQSTKNTSRLVLTLKEGELTGVRDFMSLFYLSKSIYIFSFTPFSP